MLRRPKLARVWNEIAGGCTLRAFRRNGIRSRKRFDAFGDAFCVRPMNSDQRFYS